MSVPWLLDVVSGKQIGLLANFVRFVLWSMTPIYLLGVKRRNRQFDSGSRVIESVNASVISVGNLTTGGTGKTPMVVWVCEVLQQHKFAVAIVSRGYGARTPEEMNDEALELQCRLPDVPHVQNPDRVFAAKQCIENHGTDVIVVDDGFQHRRLGRDLDMVLIDASNPFGYGYLLPRGLLREPRTSLGRADIVVITRCERFEESYLKELQNEIQRIASVPTVLARTSLISLVQSDGREFPVDDLRKENWFAFSAIGNPGAFEESLVERGMNICGATQFRDHHHFSSSELEGLEAMATKAGADRLVCTHKDLVKIDSTCVGDIPLFALKIETEILRGEDVLERAILETTKPSA